MIDSTKMIQIAVARADLVICTAIRIVEIAVPIAMAAAVYMIAARRRRRGR